MTREEFVRALLSEVDRAYHKHGREQWGRHEFYAVMLEEVDEVWGDIKKDAPMEHLVEEIIQVAAMCLRYLETGDRYGYDVNLQNSGSKEEAMTHPTTTRENHTKAEVSAAMKALFSGKQIEALDVAALSGPEVHPEIRAYAVLMWKRQHQNCPHCGRKMP